MWRRRPVLTIGGQSAEWLQHFSERQIVFVAYLFGLLAASDPNQRRKYILHNFAGRHRLWRQMNHFDEHTAPDKYYLIELHK